MSKGITVFFISFHSSLPVSLRTVVPDFGEGLPWTSGNCSCCSGGHIDVIVLVFGKGVVIIAVRFSNVGQCDCRSNDIWEPSPQCAHFDFIVEKAFVLIRDFDGHRVMDPEGVCLERSNSALKAAPPDLCCLSVHWVVDGRPPPCALLHGLLFVSVLLDVATSLEEVHRFRPVLVLGYWKSSHYLPC